MASVIGLAPIVGAYAAGLILEDVHYRELAAKEEHQLEDLIRPISAFLVPVFFVVMGMRVDLSALMRPEILGLAGALTVAAILSKQACALGALGTCWIPCAAAVRKAPIDNSETSNSSYFIIRQKISSTDMTR